VPRPNRQAERREEILDAAIALIERHDLATLRLADIAAELEIIPQAVRYYFKDMHQLLSELATFASTTTAPSLPAWVEARAPRQLVI